MSTLGCLWVWEPLYYMHFYPQIKTFKCKIEVPGLSFNSYHIIDNIHDCIKFLRSQVSDQRLWLTSNNSSFIRVMVMMMVVPVRFLSVTQTGVIWEEGIPIKKNVSISLACRQVWWSIFLINYGCGTFQSTVGIATHGQVVFYCIKNQEESNEDQLSKQYFSMFLLWFPPQAPALTSIPDKV